MLAGVSHRTEGLAHPVAGFGHQKIAIPALSFYYVQGSSAIFELPLVVFQQAVCVPDRTQILGHLRPADSCLFPDVQGFEQAFQLFGGVSVDHYRLVFTGNTSIQLSKGDPLPNPSDKLTGNNKKIDLLSEVIKRLNARWALPDFNDDDKLTFMESVQKDVEAEISKRGDLSDYSDWTSETFEREFFDTAKLQIIKRAKSSTEFYDALKNNTEAVNYLASSILKTILFSPKNDGKK